MNKSILFLSLFLISLPSYAYIGPGMGGGVIAGIIGFFAAVLLGLWGILYYPIKRALKNRKDKKMSDKIFNEIYDAYQNRGSAIKKKEDTHKMAESNKAFAHFRW